MSQPMSEQGHEKPENLTPESKAETPKPALDAQERADRQMEAKLNILEDVALKMRTTNPEYKVDDFYLGICELVYADEFPVNKIEQVVDLIDTYPFSKGGAKKFNSLVAAGDYVYLVKLLEGNLKCLDSLQSIDELPKTDLADSRATVADLGKLSVITHGKGGTYAGKTMMHGDGESAFLRIDIFYRDQDTSSNQAQRSLQGRMMTAIEEAGFIGEISEEQEAFAEQMAQKDKDIEQANADLTEEYESKKGETGQTEEDFYKDLKEEFTAENQETGITYPEFVAKKLGKSSNG